MTYEIDVTGETLIETKSAYFAAQAEKEREIGRRLAGGFYAREIDGGYRITATLWPIPEDEQ